MKFNEEIKHRMENTKRAFKSHVLVLPFPAQGHINPMLEFSKRLVSKGVKATLVETKHFNKSSHANPDRQFDVETISDGYDEGGVLAAGSSEAYLLSFKNIGSKGLADLIRKLENSSHPVDAVIYDGFLPWALDVAKELGKLGMIFFTQSCAVNNIYYHIQKGLLLTPYTGKTLSLPELPVLEALAIPSFASHPGIYPALTDMVVNQFQNIDHADWAIFNNFYDLEKEVVEWMAKMWRVATIGPTVPSMYLDKRIEDDRSYGINLWTPETSTCMNWLEDKPSESVVYVSFGSLAALGEEQMGELAWGLKASNCFFLWVVRASEEAKLPTNFIEETKEKGLVVNWCPQLEVLAHEATSCFITHCGFNSILEAVSLGVPLVAMPQWSDQPTNAKYVEDVWKVGIRARRDDTGIVRREVVEMCIREVMEGERGKELKENAKKWENLAKKALGEGGTSNKCIDEIVTSLIASKFE